MNRYWQLNNLWSLFSCRFLLGGDHGRLKYIPPEEFSPLVESLLPQQVLSIDPCFYFGNLNKVVLSGPWPVEDDTAFVPTPVDTTAVSKTTSKITRYLNITVFACTHYLN
jgi:ryanodine receptor 2